MGESGTIYNECHSVPSCVFFAHFRVLEIIFDNNWRDISATLVPEIGIRCSPGAQ